MFGRSSDKWSTSLTSDEISKEIIIADLVNFRSLQLAE